MAQKPKVVVASREGHYGGKLRQVGEQFVVSDPSKQFSENWMVDPAKDKKRAEQLQAEYRSNGGQDLPQDQIEAELEQATGKTGAAARKRIAELEQENRKLLDEVSALQAQVADLSGAGNPPANDGDTGGKDDDTGGKDDDTGGKDDDTGGETKGDPEGDSESDRTNKEGTPQRATRRRRSS